MFDLDKAIRQWCEIALSADSIHSRNIDELMDHLHCEVESIMETGKQSSSPISDKEAFAIAIKRVGESNVIADEYGKNRTLLQKLCALEYGRVGDQVSDQPLNKQLSHMKISNAILWATALLASAIILKDSEELYKLMFIVLIPLSSMSFILNTSSARNELACLVRKAKKVIKPKQKNKK
jgi:hypothetical protein